MKQEIITRGKGKGIETIRYAVLCFLPWVMLSSSFRDTMLLFSS